MAFDALETEFANAKLVRSLARRDDRRFFWRLLPTDSEQCIRLAARYGVATTTSPKSQFAIAANMDAFNDPKRKVSDVSSPSNFHFLDILSEPCGLYMFDLFLQKQKESDAIRWLHFLQQAHPTVVFSQRSVRLDFDQIVKTYLQKKEPLSSSLDASVKAMKSTHKTQKADSQFDSSAVRAKGPAGLSATSYNRHKPRSSMTAGSSYGVQFKFECDDSDLETSIANRAANSSEPFAFLSKRVLEALELSFFFAFLESVDFKRFIQLKEFALRPVTVDDFTTFRVMGRGAYGAVYAVEKVNTHRVYAWKEMNKRHLKQQRAIDVALNEVKILSELNSPFITGLRYCLQTSESLVLVLDFCSGGDLSYHMKRKASLGNVEAAGECGGAAVAPTVATNSTHQSTTVRRRKKKPLAPDLLLIYAAEIILGLEHMHEHRIVFRDLKPANILLDMQGHVQISDLGLAKKFSDRKPSTSSLGGTPGYWAPEVLARQPYAQWVDWWSFAVFLYEAICGMRPACRCVKGTSEWCPFIDSREHEDNAKNDGVLKLSIDFSENYFSSEAKDLIQQMLRPVPSSRLGYHGSQDIKAHDFFKDVDWVAVASKSVTPSFVPGTNVHACSVQEVGEVNKQRYKKVPLDHKDHKLFAQFKYVNDRVVQEELVRVLIEENENEGSKWTPFEIHSGVPGKLSHNCCTIL
uniref:Protein kinase domain-containing protein n=1 Tax=Spongospora subterranea TaxID=70186 RepID=A0A0H5QUB6_9EUKA|eukprot:CRZ05495.1 hypothetical protein [Spongospora subterranea]